MWVSPRWSRPCDVSILLGTYNRHTALAKSVEHARKAVGDLSYEIVVCDGGSTDGSREWLAAQRDVVLVGDRRLTGAVAAFNMAFVLSRGRYIVALNDDCAIEKDAVLRAIALVGLNPRVGQVAFELNVGRTWGVNKLHGVPWANYGLVRREVVEQVAAVCGGFWSPAYVTYGADVELSFWIWRLGYEVLQIPGLRVTDLPTKDGLRARNMANTRSVLEAALLQHRWPTEEHVWGALEPVVDQETLLRYRQVRRNVEGPLELRTCIGATGGSDVAVAALDPVEGQMLQRASSGPPERVLHFRLGPTPEDQPSEVAGLQGLGSAGYHAVFSGAEDVVQQALAAARELRPSVVFIQIQADVFRPEFIAALRKEARNPDLVIVNWSGDCANQNAPNAAALGWAARLAAISGGVDLTLWCSLTHVRVLRGMGVVAGYLAQGYNQRCFYEGLVENLGSRYEVAFLYHEHSKVLRASLGEYDGSMARLEVAAALQRAFGQRAIVGAAPRGSAADSVKRAEAGSIYRSSRFAVSVSASSTLERCTSSRLFDEMACTATAVKRFTGYEGLGLRHEENCLIFDTPAELVSLLRRYGEPARRETLLAIKEAGARFVRENHSWDVRMQELRVYLAAVRAVRGR